MPLGEFDLIRTYLAPLAHPDFAHDLSDDVASFVSDQPIVVNTDTLVEGVHYFRGTAPSDIARKLLRVNLSDLAAKAAKPFGYLLNLTLPESCSNDWWQDFAKGLAADQAEFGIHLLGGDTTRSDGPAVLSATMLGYGPETHLQRSGLKAGDRLYVTGNIGDAGLALKALQSNTSPDALLLKRYLHPEPRLACREFLRKFASASIDISDGLLADSRHLSTASKVRLEIDLDAVPLSASGAQYAKTDPARWLEMVTAGDDYEVLFGVSERHILDFDKAMSTIETPVSLVGHVHEGNGLSVKYQGQVIKLPQVLGFQHF